MLVRIQSDRVGIRGNEMLEQVTSIMHRAVTILDWIVAGAVVVMALSVLVTM